MADKCECRLPLDPPNDGTEWWQPTVDDDPGPKVRAVIRVGDEPTLRRAVRRPDGGGWTEEGAEVNFYREITPPMAWERTGMCVRHEVARCE